MIQRLQPFSERCVSSGHIQSGEHFQEMSLQNIPLLRICPLLLHNIDFHVAIVSSWLIFYAMGTVTVMYDTRLLLCKMVLFPTMYVLTMYVYEVYSAYHPTSVQENIFVLYSWWQNSLVQYWERNVFWLLATRIIFSKGIILSMYLLHTYSI